MQMDRFIEKNCIVEFIRGGIAHGMQGQVKKIYDDGNSVRVVIMPVKDINYPLTLEWRVDDIKKV